MWVFQLGEAYTDPPVPYVPGLFAIVDAWEYRESGSFSLADVQLAVITAVAEAGVLGAQTRQVGPYILCLAGPATSPAQLIECVSSLTDAFAGGAQNVSTSYAWAPEPPPAGLPPDSVWWFSCEPVVLSDAGFDSTVQRIDMAALGLVAASQAPDLIPSALQLTVIHAPYGSALPSHAALSGAVPLPEQTGLAVQALMSGYVV